MRPLVQASVTRPVSTLMVLAAVLILGIGAAFTLGLADLPEVSVPRMVVSTSWPGLPASEVRELLTKPLEDALAGVRGLKTMESISRQGFSTISLEFHWGTDIQTIGVELREAVDAAWSILPSDAEKPLVLPLDPADEVLMVIGVVPKQGDLLMARRLADREIKTRLQQVRGAGSVIVVGGQTEEIQVDVDRSQLTARNATLEELANRLSAANYDYPAGVLTEGPRQLTVKTRGTVASAAKLAELWCGNVRLGDIGRIKEGKAEAKSSFAISGTEAVGMYIHRQAGVSPLESAYGIKAELERLKLSYGQDLDFVLAWDGTVNIRRGLQDLVAASLIGIAIAFVVLLLFMRDPTVSLIIISAVPISIVASLIGLRLFGRTINLMSIGGLALGIGLMIDNSVVIIEHLARGIGLDQGRKPKTVAAVIERTLGLSMSNLGSTATSIIVFVPIMFLPGLVGAVFSDLALTVILAQLASFFVSITVVPVLFLLLPQWRQVDGGRLARFDPIKSFEARFAVWFLALVRKPLILGAVIVGFLGVGALCFWALPFEFMPQVDAGVIDVTLTLEDGMTVERSAASGRYIADQLQSIEGVDYVFSRTGGEADDTYYHADARERSSLVKLRVVLGKGNRPTAQRILVTVQEALAAIRAQSGPDWSFQAELPVNPVARLLGLDNKSPDMVISASNQSELAQAVERFQASRPAGAESLQIYPSGQLEEMRFTPDREALAHSQAGLESVALAMRGGSDGLVASRLLKDGRPIPIRLRMSERSSWRDFLLYPIRTADGRLVTASDLGSLATVQSVPALYRKDRQDASQLVGPGLEKIALESGWSRPAAGTLQEQAGWFGLTLLLILVLLYLFLGAQLQSMVLPGLLMLALPLAFGGIFLALFLARSSINFDSLLGIVVLFGIVINNSLVLYENYLHLQGMGRSSLGMIIAGTRQRIRPIVVTGSITVVSLLPIALDFSGASTQSSMAIAVVGGLIVSTLLTLFVIPLVFFWHFRRQGHV